MSNFYDLMNAARDVESIDSLNEVMARYFDNIGFDKYAYVLVNNPNDTAMNNAYVSNFPLEWEQRYTACNYFKIDPLYELFKEKKKAFSWGWTKNKEILNYQQKRFFWEANDFGTDKGVGVPIFSPHGGFSIMSLCSSYIPEDELHIYLKEKEKDLVIASLIHHQATLALKTEVKTYKDYNLTHKELEALHWLCQNKTYDEIGMIIGIKREGVSQRLRGVYRKMGACGRIDAIKIAIRSGLMKLSVIFLVWPFPF